MGTMTQAKELFSKARQPIMQEMCFKMLTTIGKQVEPNQTKIWYIQQMHSNQSFAIHLLNLVSRILYKDIDLNNVCWCRHDDPELRRHDRAAAEVQLQVDPLRQPHRAGAGLPGQVSCHWSSWFSSLIGPEEDGQQDNM